MLKGLNFLKSAQDPVALEDEAYPEWLWSALERQGEGEKGESVEGDLFGKLVYIYQLLDFIWGYAC